MGGIFYHVWMRSEGVEGKGEEEEEEEGKGKGPMNVYLSHDCGSSLHLQLRLLLSELQRWRRFLSSCSYCYRCYRCYGGRGGGHEWRGK